MLENYELLFFPSLLEYVRKGLESGIQDISSEKPYQGLGVSLSSRALGPAFSSSGVMGGD